MRYILSLLLLIQGVLMSAELHFLDLNGTKVPMIFEEDTTLPIVSMQVVFQKSGSIEDGDLPGLAKMSARMLSQGTKSLGNVGFAQKLEDKAIRFGVHTGTETMVMELSSLKEQFEYGVDLVSKLFVEPNLTPQTLQKVKTNTLGYLARKKDDYDYIASVNLKKLLFAGTPLQNPSDGTKESIEKITLKDIEGFLAKHLVRTRAVVVIGGDLSLDEAKKIAKKMLEPLQKGELEPLPFYEASDKQQTKIQKEEQTQQAYIYFGAPYHERIDSDDLYLGKVAMFILGSGGFGSRLMEEIRVKRGLAYSAYAFSRVNKSHSYFTGYLQTKIESQEEAKKLVAQVIDEFVKNGATQKELESAKKFILGSEPLRNETLPQRLSRAFHEFYAGRPLGYSKKELELISKVTLEQLNHFITSHPEITKLSYSIVTK